MPTDFREVLKELRAEEARLTEELGVIRGMIPGAELMAKKMPQVPVWISTKLDELPHDELLPLGSPKAFANMGTKEAILHLLGGVQRPLMPAAMTKLLLEGGVQTKSTDFAGTVGSTLTQLKADGLVERKDEGWVLVAKPAQDPMVNPPMNVSASSWISSARPQLPRR